MIGSYNSNRTAQFVSDHIGENYSFQTVESSRTGYRALIWNAGLMYDYVFDYKVRADGSRGAPNKYLTFGLTYQSERPLNTETDQSIVRRNITIGSIDTLTSATGIEGQGVLPATINFGASYVFKDLWRAGINYEQGFWSNFRNGQVEQTLDTKDAFKISGGFAYTPNASSITSYFDKVTYSVSGYYEKDPRVLGGEQIENYGAKIGFMLPFVGQRQVSYLNLNVGFGRLGLADGYRENYLTIGMGYSLTDNQWFIKRKYD